MCSTEPRQPSKALLRTAQRKKYHVFSFPCHCSSAQMQNMHGERKGGLSLPGLGCSPARHLDLGSLWPVPRSHRPEYGRPEFNSPPGCLKTIPAPGISTWLHLGSPCCAGTRSSNLCLFLSPADLPCESRRTRGLFRAAATAPQVEVGQGVCLPEEDHCSGRGCSTVSRAGCPVGHPLRGICERCLMQVRTLQNSGHLYKFQIDAAAEM